MGNILDYAKQHFQSPEMPESKSGEAIEARVQQLAQNNEWPFKTISPDAFLDATRPLIQVVCDIYSESGDPYKDKPFDLIQDKLHYAIVNMLTCVQEMEMEARRQDLKEQILDKEQKSYTPEYDKMFAVAAWAKEELYRYADHVNGYMKHTYDIVGQTPLDIEKWDKEFRPRLALEETYKATKRHSQAFHKLAARFDLLMQYGLPSESAIMRRRDERKTVEIETKNGKQLQTVAQIKADNEKCVVELVRAQFDIDRIGTITIPQIERETDKKYSAAKLDDFARQQAGLRGKSDLWEDHYRYGKILTRHDKAVNNMYEREAKRMGNNTLGLSRDENFTYTLNAGRKRGNMEQFKVKDGEVIRTKTVEKMTKEMSRAFKLTTISARVKQEQTDRMAQIYGDKTVESQKTHNPKRNNEEKRKVSEKIVGRIGLSTSKKRRLSEDRSARIRLTGLLGKVSASMTKFYTEDSQTKQEKVWSAGAEIGGTVTLDAAAQSRVGAKLSAEAHASADAQYKQLGASATMGPSASVGTVISIDEFNKELMEALKKEIAKGKDMDLLSLQKQFTDVLEAAGFHKNMNWGTLTINFGEDFTPLEVKGDLKQDEQTQEKHYTLEAKSPLLQEAKDLIEEGKKMYQFFQGPEAYTQVEKPNARTSYRTHETVMLDR